LAIVVVATRVWRAVVARPLWHTRPANGFVQSRAAIPVTLKTIWSRMTWSPTPPIVTIR